MFPQDTVTANAPTTIGRASKPKPVHVARRAQDGTESVDTVFGLLVASATGVLLWCALVVLWLVNSAPD
jgi:hypothetical protein